MIQINKQGNAIVIEFTDNDKYLFDGTIEIAPNELMVVVDESLMATFKRVSNGDTLFSQKVEDIQINGITAAKDTVIDLFGSIGYTSGGGGGGGTGAVSSVNGQTGDVFITAAGIGAMTRAQADAAYATKEDLEEKQEVFQVNAPMAFNRDEATLDLHLSIDLTGLATKEELNSKQDALVSGTNIKTINNLSILGEGNIEITGGSTPTVYSCTTYDSFSSSSGSIWVNDLTADQPYKVGDIIHVISLMYLPEVIWDLEIIGIYNFYIEDRQYKQLILSSVNSDTAYMYIDTQNINSINKVKLPQPPVTYSANINEDLGTDQKTFRITDGIVYNYYSIRVGDSIRFYHNIVDELGMQTSQKSWDLQFIGVISENGQQNKWILSGLNGNIFSHTLEFNLYDELGMYALLTANFSADITVDSELNIDSTNPIENKAVTTALNNKQDTLVSGTTIKTINGKSILGGGNIDITAEGGTIAVDAQLSDTSENPVQNKVINNALGTKLDTLVSGTNIKTINNLSILGEGNINIEGGGGSGSKTYEVTLMLRLYPTGLDSSSSFPISGLNPSEPKVGDIINFNCVEAGVPWKWTMQIIGIEDELDSMTMNPISYYYLVCPELKSTFNIKCSDPTSLMQLPLMRLQSGSDLKSINGQSIIGAGEITINSSEEIHLIGNLNDITEQGATISQDPMYMTSWDMSKLKVGNTLSVSTESRDTDWSLEIIGSSGTMMPGAGVYYLSGNDSNKQGYKILASDITKIYPISSTSISVDSELNTTSENPVQNKVITTALEGKQDKAVVHSATVSDSLTSMNPLAISGLEGVDLKIGDTINFKLTGTEVYWDLQIVGKISQGAGMEKWALSGVSNDYILLFLDILNPTYIDRVTIYRPKYFSVILLEALGTTTINIPSFSQPIFNIGDIFSFYYLEADGQQMWSLQILGSTENGLKWILSGYNNVASYILDVTNVTVNGQALLIPNGISHSVDSELSAESENPVQNKVINAALAVKADSSTVEALSTEVATVSTNVANLTTKVNEDSDKIASLDTEMGNKQNTLVSGTNIKTINGTSILGEGNIEIQEGEEIRLFHQGDNMGTLSELEKAENKAIYDDLKAGKSFNIILKGESETNLCTHILFLNLPSENYYYLFFSFPNAYINNIAANVLTFTYFKVYKLYSDGTINFAFKNNELKFLGDYFKGSLESTSVGINIKQSDIETVTAKGQGLADSYDVKQYVDSHSSTVTVDVELSTESENPVQNKVITTALNGKQAAGDYALKSEIPDTSTLATKTEVNTLSQEVEHKADKTTVYTMDEVNTKLATKQATLVAGANITLSDPDAEGKVTIAATQPDISGITTTVEELTGEVATLSTDKQDNLVSGTNIKTINGESVLGTGDINTDVLYEVFPSIQAGGDATKMEANKKVYDLLQSGVYPRIYASEDINGKYKTKYYATYIQIESNSINIEFSRFKPNGKGNLIGSYSILILSDGTSTSLNNKSMNYVVGVTGNYISKDSYGLVSVAQTNIADATATGTGLADAYDVKQYVDSHSGGSVTVDTEMSDTSENAVQNKVIKAYIDSLVGNILTQLQEINGTN